ncbi:hypothetical protein ACWD6I_24405 [Streptomyces sp. NPDC002454]
MPAVDLVERLPGRIAAALALAGIVAGVFVGDTSLETVPGCGYAGDPYPSQTARDWVDHADHVVVATPVREREVNRKDFPPPNPVRYRTDRALTLRADEVLWSTRSPGRTMGEEFELTAPGWRVFRPKDRRAKSKAGNAPRLEAGHTYLLALRWSGGRWTVLGEGAAVPFDEGTAGRGEWCGRELGEEDVARGERFSHPDDRSLEKALLGRGAEEFTRELERARRK